jgi:hypothetical protein
MPTTSIIRVRTALDARVFEQGLRNSDGDIAGTVAVLNPIGCFVFHDGSGCAYCELGVHGCDDKGDDELHVGNEQIGDD